jgi:hypothetical protein
VLDSPPLPPTRKKAPEGASETACKLLNRWWSGREDSNLRPLGPEPSALARLSHAPTVGKRRKNSMAAGRRKAF